MPIAHGEGNYFLPDAELDALEARRGVLFRYAAPEGNPNGSARDIAGVIDARRPGVRADAPPGARRGGDPGLGRRDAPVPLARGERRRPAPAAAGRRDERVSPTTRADAAPPRAGRHGRGAGRHRERLGRAPNDLELAMFSVMWSEHCSYKSSQAAAQDAAHRRRATWSRGRARTRAWCASATASRSPSSSSRTTIRAPWSRTRAPPPASAASCATSSRWARGPIAVLDGAQVRRPVAARTRHLVRGVVRGVGGYGNCVGVPTDRRRARVPPELRREPAGQRDGRGAAGGRAS